MKRTVSLTEKELTNIKIQCQDIFSQLQTTILELMKLIRLLSSSAEAVFPARIQLRYLQQEQIVSLQQRGSYQATIVLDYLAKEELLWKIVSLRLANSRSLQRKRCIAIQINTTIADGQLLR